MHYQQHGDVDEDMDNFLLARYTSEKIPCCCGKKEVTRLWCMVLFIALIIPLIILSVLLAMAAGSYINTVKIVPSTNYPNNTLIAGINWFGLGDKSMPATHPNNPYYQPNAAKVLIYSHGWQPEKYMRRNLEDFNYANNDRLNGVDVNTVDAWIKDGWLVGIWYWTQLADEPQVADAEAKIWVTDGPKGMRWRKRDGSFNTTDEPKKNVAELLTDAIVASLSNHNVTISEFRLAGHSLGNQVVCHTTQVLSERVANKSLREDLRPKRVALLDPYYSNGAKPYLKDQTVGNMCLAIIKDTVKQYDIAWEQFKTSAITDEPYGDAMLPIQHETAFVERDPTYISEFSLSSKHQAAPNLYFWSYAFDQQPNGYTVEGVLDGRVAHNCRSTLEDTKKRMKSKYKYVQIEGNDTPTPEDDGFIDWDRLVEAPGTWKYHVAIMTRNLAVSMALVFLIYWVDFARQRIWKSKKKVVLFGLVQALVALLALIMSESQLRFWRGWMISMICLVHGLTIFHSSSKNELGDAWNQVWAWRFFNPHFKRYDADWKKISSAIFFQPLAAWLVTSPVVALNAMPANSPFHAGDATALVIMIFAYVYGFVAYNQQVDVLKTGRHVVVHGLRHWCRHPDEFADWLFQFGIFVACAMGFIQGAGNFNYATTISPALYALWIGLVAIPQRESLFMVRKNAQDGLEQWLKTTSVFIPVPANWFPFVDAVSIKLRAIFTLPTVNLLLGLALIGIIVSMQIIAEEAKKLTIPPK